MCRKAFKLKPMTRKVALESSNMVGSINIVAMMPGSMDNTLAFVTGANIMRTHHAFIIEPVVLKVVVDTYTVVVLKVDAEGTDQLVLIGVDRGKGVEDAQRVDAVTTRTMIMAMTITTIAIQDHEETYVGMTSEHFIRTLYYFLFLGLVKQRTPYPACMI